MKDLFYSGRGRRGPGRGPWRGLAAESGALRLTPSVQLLAGSQQAGQVLLLPRERLAVPRVAGLGLAEGARVVDGAPGAVGDAAQVVVEHLVVNDALEEVARHLAPVEHGMDADEGEHRVVAAEGEPAAPGPAAPAAPRERYVQAPREEARVEAVVDLAEGVGLAAGGPRRRPARHPC